MKRLFLSITLFLVPSFVLSALQGNLYFLPIGVPAFWCIFTAFYSFRKSLLFSLLLNIFHCMVVLSFAKTSMGSLLLSMNLMTLALHFVSQRFHTSLWHISFAATGASFLYPLFSWTSSILNGQIFFPPLFHWIGQSIMTFLFSIVIINILDHFDQKIQHEKIDTLENLRI